MSVVKSATLVTGLALASVISAHADPVLFTFTGDSHLDYVIVLSVHSIFSDTIYIKGSFIYDDETLTVSFANVDMVNAYFGDIHFSDPYAPYNSINSVGFSDNGYLAYFVFGDVLDKKYVTLTNPDGSHAALSFIPGFSGAYSPYGYLVPYGGNGGVTASAVPEASTWGMMALGFAGIGLAMRRRAAKIAMDVA